MKVELMLFSRQKTTMVTPETALGGRETRPFSVPSTHYVLSTPLEAPYPDGLEIAYFAEGCFWGVERIFWQVEGVVSTAVGYQGGITPNPSYDEVCSARTGHTETVKVVFDPKKVSYAELLKIFWESHDPTQGMQQGNDTGTQYRSAIFTTSAEQQKAAEASRDAYQPSLSKVGYGAITTEIEPAPEFYYAEDYHQQYLAKNPGGYCPVHATGVSCPVGLGVATSSVEGMAAPSPTV
jgi:peptide-methionine (S)-S-oxide reductase